MADPPSTRQLPSLAGADWLARRQTRAVFDALAAGGFAARAVGGAVRNALLGRPVVDIDIATPARPEQVMAAARAAGLAAVPTGLDARHRHGDRRATSPHEVHDAARGRRDARPPRHRRLHRRLGGRRTPARLHHQRALLQRRRRGVRPARRLWPISRRAACASSARHGSASARTTCASCASSGLRPSMAKARLTPTVSPPASPSAKGWRGCRPSGCARRCCACWRRRAAPELVRAMQDYGLLALRAARRPAAAAARPPCRHRSRARACRRCRVAARRAGGRAAGGRRPAARAPAPLQRGACAARTRGRNARQTSGPARPRRAAKACLYADGAAAYRERVLMAWARVGCCAHEPGLARPLRAAERWQPPRFPLGGADVMALGVAPGPRVGELLRALEDGWVAGDFAADEPALRAELQRHGGASLTRARRSGKTRT